MKKDLSAAIMIRLIFYFLRTERRQTRSCMQNKKITHFSENQKKQLPKFELK